MLSVLGVYGGRDFRVFLFGPMRLIDLSKKMAFVDCLRKDGWYDVKKCFVCGKQIPFDIN